MELKIDQKHYDKYVEIYNDQGSLAAKDYVSNICGMDINQFQRKMRRETETSDHSRETIVSYYYLKNSLQFTVSVSKKGRKPGLQC